MRGSWPTGYARKCCGPVYHGEHGLRTLRELGRSHQTISQDLNRVINRIKALYRGWGIAYAGTQVHALRYREEWLHKIGTPACVAEPEEEMRDYFNAFNETNEPEIGRAMLDDVAVFRESLRQLDQASVVVFGIVLRWLPQ
jgi:hypothetical protein